MRLSIFTGKGVFVIEDFTRLYNTVRSIRSFITNKQIVRKALIEGYEDKLQL